MATREELLETVSNRYLGSSRAEKSRILEEFSMTTGYHRKHAMRLLRAGPSDKRSAPRPSRRIYDTAVREALVVVWEASDRVCGKRLKAIIPTLLSAMQHHGHLALAPEVHGSLLKMSAATIDRVLAPQRERFGRSRRRSGAAMTIRRSIPVRTFSDWNDPVPGFVEADLVSHSGPVASGSFVQTLVLTDIATGWTDFAPVLVREQHLVVEVLREIRRRLPFPLLGFDVDNDSVFMNETIRDYCRSEKIELTRCRPYRKNDQAHVEQKNGEIVRRMIGYRRYEGIAAAKQLATLHERARLFVNVFQASFKLAAKTRDGARVTKRYHKPMTPCDRLLADSRIGQDVRDRVLALRTGLDPVRLLAEIRREQQTLVTLADAFDCARSSLPPPETAGIVPIETFVANLSIAWQSGEVRPTSRAKPKAKRGRRRPDPLVSVTEELRAWFDADPSQTARELLARLKASQPDYPDALLRTLQRRLKVWRGEMAQALVFGRSELTGAGNGPVRCEC
jgi:hypothetical protein